MFKLIRIRPEEDERASQSAPRSFGALIVDEAVLNRLIGPPISHGSDAPAASAFERALSPQGQLALKQAWEAAQAAPSPRRLGPAAPFLLSSSGGGSGSGGGLDPGALVALLSALLPGLAVWQLWDVVGALQRHDGTVPCWQLQLVAVLVAATVSEQQAQALYACQAPIHAAFCSGGGGGGGSSGCSGSRPSGGGDGESSGSSGGGGSGSSRDTGGGSGGGGSPLRGLRACALLLGMPPVRLYAAAGRLGLAGSSALDPEEVSLLLFAALQGSSGGSGGGGERQQQPEAPGGGAAAVAAPGCWPCTRCLRR